MRHKRLKLITVILLGLGLTAVQAQRIYIGEKEGSQTAYFLSDIKKMSFSEGKITVFRADHGLDTYTITDVRNLNFMAVTTVVQDPLPIKKEGAIFVFPNPVVDVLNIELSSPLQSAGRIEIISMEGKLVYAEAIDGNAVVFQVHLSGLAKGLYLCRIKSGLAIETTKIIKQ
jgi:hypothetical protein